MKGFNIRIINFIFAGKIFIRNIESNFFMSILKLIYLIIIFLIILGASYYLSKYIAKKNSRKNRLMKLVETLSLGYDKNIHIIKIGEVFFLVSSTQKGINLLDKLSKEEIDKQMLFNRETLDEDGQQFRDYIDEFTYKDIRGYESNIRKNINKLKNFIKGSRAND